MPGIARKPVRLPVLNGVVPRCHLLGLAPALSDRGI